MTAQACMFKSVEMLGGVTYVHAFTDAGERLVFEERSLNPPKSGDQVGVKFSENDTYLFDIETEARITI